MFLFLIKENHTIQAILILEKEKEINSDNNKKYAYFLRILNSLLYILFNFYKYFLKFFTYNREKM